MRTTIAACAFLIAVLAAPEARAEINVAESLGWMVRDADVVVRGRVIRLHSRRGPGSVVWYDVTVRVAETIKGTRRRTVRFRVRHVWGPSPRSWKTGKAELLLFLVDSQRRAGEDRGYLRAPLALRKAMRHAAITLRRPKLFTRTLQVLSSRTAVLRATRRAAKASRRSTPTSRFRIDVPFNTPVFNALYGGSSVWLYVPVDRTLERNAHAWIRARDIYHRVQGARALAHFRSAKNIALLRKLLADPGFVTETGGGRSDRVFVVRRAALKTLRAWQLRVHAPVIRRPAP